MWKRKESEHAGLSVTEPEKTGLAERRDVEVVEVEVERLGVRPSKRRAFLAKAWAILGPVVFALLVDAGDLLTGSPLMIPFALPAGMLVGYIFSGFLDVTPTWRIGITLATGIYWASPFTALIPLATVSATVGQIAAPGSMQEEPFG